MSDSTVRFPTTDTWVNDRPECKPFGTRYLVDETRVWDYNAWDNVDWSDEMERRALQAVDAQKAHAVDNLRAKKLIEEPSKQWDAFYSKHTNNFFKDRKWLLKEFPELDMANYPENKKSLLRLSSETLRFRSVFDDLLKAPEIRKLLAHSELKGDIYLTYVLFYEFLVGAGLEKASARVKAVINKYSKAIHDREKSLAVIGRGIAAVKENEKPRQFARFIPRYARVNTLRWTMREAVERLIYEGWKVVFLTAADDFAHEVKNMSGYQVFVDPHIENLLVFPQSADFYSYWLVEQGYLILQDKASCLPAYLLSPSLDSHVFDACAAPGMKTSHVAAILRGGGRVWAMDRSENRVKIMTKLLKQCGAENISILHGDFLKIDINDKRFSKVNYAIVDPPCSGSGMVKRMDELTGQNFTPERLKKLKNLQAMILKHALKFPYLKRLVYSTCSVHEEENEQVVDEVLSDTYISQSFRLASSVLPEWKFRGLDKFGFGINCLRADPAKTLTNGFFVAVFEKVVACDTELKTCLWNQKSYRHLEESGSVTISRNRILFVEESSKKVFSDSKSLGKRKRKNKV